MEEMIGNIQNQLYNVIDTVEWIKSDNTRKVAKEKAAKMAKLIGYPEWLDDPASLSTYYKTVR